MRNDQILPTGAELLCWGLGFDSQNDQHREELAAFAMISTNGLSRKNYYDGDDDDDDDDDDESKETIKENLGVDIGDLIWLTSLRLSHLDRIVQDDDDDDDDDDDKIKEIVEENLCVDIGDLICLLL
ncbi:hypothetical protein ACROYT_G041145 [Oculina patagonica]